MYRPARSAEGMAATVMFDSPALVSAASPASLCAAAHPASIMITAAASAAARTCPLFIIAPPGIATDPGLTSRCYQRAGRAAARLLIRDPFVPRSCHIRPHCEQNGEPDAPRLPPLTCLRRLVPRLLTIACSAAVLVHELGLVHDDAPDDLPVVQVLVALVDLVEPVSPGDEL